MMKNLRFFFLSMLVMLTGTALADDLTVVFDPAVTFGANTSASGQDTMEKDGITFVTTAGGLHCNEYRFAKSSVTTITSTVGNITKIVFTCTASNTDKYGPGCFAAQDGYSFEGNTGTWTGNAAEVTFTAESAQVRASKIVVTVGEGSGEEPGPGDDPVETEGQTPETAITVERALEMIGELADGAKTSYSYYVKGKVTVAEAGNSGISTSYNNATFSMGDLVVFRAKGLKNGDITSDDYVKVGDDVVVYGQLQKYVKDDVTTPEVAQGGYIYSINGQTEPNPDDLPTEPAIDGGTTPETAITVAAALAAIDQMKDGQKTTGSYYVKGVVLSVTEISTANGNATFVMADAAGSEKTFTVFRAKGLEKKNIESEDYLQDGDEVVVYGQLQRYVKDNVMTPELAQGGYVYSLNGKTKEDVEPYTQVGDGSMENPFTVQDLKHMGVPEVSNPEEGQQMVWVKGVILGSLNSSGSALLEGENIAASNIALGETAGATEAKDMLPVQLPAGDLRAKLNVLDNPQNVGKEVQVLGYILKYMNKTGLKNVADFILDGEKFSDGISIVAADKADATLYNLAGQRVRQQQKGLYIQQGRKVVVK
jgi:hypothetical protein